MSLDVRNRLCNTSTSKRIVLIYAFRMMPLVTANLFIFQLTKKFSDSSKFGYIISSSLHIVFQDLKTWNLNKYYTTKTDLELLKNLKLLSLFNGFRSFLVIYSVVPFFSEAKLVKRSSPVFSYVVILKHTDNGWWDDVCLFNQTFWKWKEY